jgi:hypothetical protein
MPTRREAMKFEELVGKKVKFYGVDSTKFKLGKDIFEAVEDENDGYRSMLGSVEVRDPSGLVFFKRAIAEVTVVAVSVRGGFDGWHLVDDDGHVWLRLGTDDYDDYYPTFIFDYLPKPQG